jgi:hypothetical protein
MLIFLISLPGFGIETRKPSDYQPWAGPVFLILTLLVFAFGVAALVAARSSASWLVRLGVAQGAAALLTNVLDISHVGGPPPPTGPLVLGAISIAVAILEFAFAAATARAPPSAPNSGGPVGPTP